MRRLTNCLLAAIARWIAVTQDWIAIQLRSLVDDDPKEVWFHDPPAPRWIVVLNWTLVVLLIVLLTATIGSQVWHVIDRNLNH